MCLAWLTMIVISCTIIYLKIQFSKPEQGQLQNWIKLSSICCIVSYLILFTVQGAWHTSVFTSNNNEDYTPVFLLKGCSYTQILTGKSFDTNMVIFKLLLKMFANR